MTLTVVRTGAMNLQINVCGIHIFWDLVLLDLFPFSLVAMKSTSLGMVESCSIWGLIEGKDRRWGLRGVSLLSADYLSESFLSYCEWPGLQTANFPFPFCAAKIHPLLCLFSFKSGGTMVLPLQFFSFLPLNRQIHTNIYVCVRACTCAWVEERTKGRKEEVGRKEGREETFNPC